MALTLGTRLGTYEVLATIGAGGMGEVYRARDITLNRDVALKVLPDAFIRDPDRLVRFKREAQMLASLNHPNIAAIYGFEESNSVQALVLELVEGPTLADRIAQGPIPFVEALSIARQIAEALEAAHEQGIIHRDLKPANIKLRPDGTVKVLDFGLAKRPVDPGAPGQDPAALVTASTQAGTVFGTPAYMAPELLRGGVADARSDIFALGIVVFEVWCGKHPFHRPSIFETAEAILNPAPPQWPDAVLMTSVHLQRVVGKALEKDANQRYQAISEIKRDLASLTGASPTSSADTSPPSSGATPPRRPSFWTWRPAVTAGAFLAALVAVAGAIWWAKSTPATATPSVLRHTQVTFIGNVRGIALSPDGRTAAYGTTGVTEGHVMVRDVAGGQAIDIWQGDLVVEMKWLPDGSAIVVTGIQKNEIGVWVVPRLGGTARRLPTTGAHLAVSPDGQQLALAMQNSAGFHVLPLVGGERRTVKMEGFRWLLGLDWGATTNRVAVLTQADDGTVTVWTTAPDGTDLRRIYTGVSVASIRWSPIDDVIYAIRPNGDVADIVRLVDREGLAAEAEIVVAGLPWDSSDPYQQQASLSTDGHRLLFARSFAYANLWKFSLSNTERATALTEGTARYGRPRISPDGNWIATSVATSGRSAIVKIAIHGGEAVPLTPGDAGDDSPAWSRDGRQIAFRSVRGAEPQIRVVDSDGRSTMGVSNTVVETQGVSGIDWMPDERLAWTLPGSQNVAVRDLRTGAQELLVARPAGEPTGWLADLRVSPDGQQIVVWWNRPRGEEEDGMWLIRWPSREEIKLLPGNFYPAGWSPDSQSVYAYEYLGKALVRVSVKTGTSQPIGVSPQGVLDGCDVEPTGASLVCSIRETKSDAWLIDGVDRKDPESRYP